MGRRQLRLLFFDFEEYSGPFFFLCDGIAFAFLIFVLYLLLTAPPMQPVYLKYVIVWLLYFVLVFGMHVFRICIISYATSDVMQDRKTGVLDPSRTLAFIFSAITNVRPKKVCDCTRIDASIESVFSVLDTIALLPFSQLAMATFFALGMYFVFEIAVDDPGAVWTYTVANYPAVNTVTCALISGAETTLQLFFEITNNIAVIDALLGMDGLYFTVLGYRSRIRVFYQMLWSDVQKACGTATDESILENSVMSLTSVFVVIVLLSLMPFAVFRDSRSLFENYITWIVAFVAPTVIFVAMYLLNDVGLLFFSLVIPGSNITVVHSSLGATAYTVLACMSVCALFLCATSSARARVTYKERITSGIGKAVARAEGAARSLLKLVLSEGMLLAFVSVVFSLAMVGSGLPVQRVYFRQINGTEPWPSYMSLNKFEVALSDFRSIKDMFEDVITNVTAMNVDMFETLASDIFDEVVGGSIGSTLSSLTRISGDWLGNELETVERASVDIVFAAAEIAGGVALNVLDDALKYVIGLANINLHISDALHAVEDFLAHIPSLWVWVPTIVIVLMILTALMGVFMPRAATFVESAVLLGSAQALLGLVSLGLTIRAMVLQFNYETVVDLKNGGLSLVLYCAMVVLSIMACFMIVTIEQEGLTFDADVDRLVSEFEQDYPRETQRRLTSRKLKSYL